MPDISMCTHKTCPLRQFCYRHAESGTVPAQHQTYAEFPQPKPRDWRLPVNRNAHYWDCDDYIPVDNKP